MIFGFVVGCLVLWALYRSEADAGVVKTSPVRELSSLDIARAMRGR